ncbi:uric acid degradation bifunctional protein TTL isoform X1 [Capsicum galapagoense]
MGSVFDEKDFLASCGSTKFSNNMVAAGPFSTLQDAIQAARDIWFNKVDVNGWLEAFAAHPQIGQTPSRDHKSPTFAQWSKGEQSTAMSTATEVTLQIKFGVQELVQWNARYREKFGFVFLICASGRSTPEILTELKIRYQNRPIIEFEIAAQEQMKITELRLAKLFSNNADTAPAIKSLSTTNIATKAEEDRVNIIGVHLTAATRATGAKPAHIPNRTRPPITTHVLDTSRGCPASGIEVRLEMWKDNQARPQFGEADIGGWILLGSSSTDKDGRSGQLLNMVEDLVPGVYRISFNTGKYNPNGFFPYVSIVFEIRESQKWDHFHVPLLLSPFSLSTYRGS